MTLSNYPDDVTPDMIDEGVLDGQCETCGAEYSIAAMTRDEDSPYPFCSQVCSDRGYKLARMIDMKNAFKGDRHDREALEWIVDFVSEVLWEGHRGGVK